MKVKNYRDVKAEPIIGETGVLFRWLSDEPAETSDCGLCLYEIEPGAFSIPQTHYRERQVFVLAGSGTVRGEGSERPLGVGDVVCVPPTEQHQFVNRGQEVLHLLVVFQMPRLVTLAGPA
ncbi:MAG: cupin domain-containing protein [Chloroflexota bacterium]